jgi:hypothetical protein
MNMKKNWGTTFFFSPQIHCNIYGDEICKSIDYQGHNKEKRNKKIIIHRTIELNTGNAYSFDTMKENVILK